MRSDYERWEKSIGRAKKCKMLDKEGYPFIRNERIVMGGTIFNKDNNDIRLSISGTLAMTHPTDTGAIYGNCVGRWGESYIEGRLTEEELDFIEHYVILHSLDITRKYHLKKEGSIWVGEFSCSKKNKQFSEGGVEIDVLESKGFFPPKVFDVVLPQGKQHDYAKSREFWNMLPKRRGYFSPYTNKRS